MVEFGSLFCCLSGRTRKTHKSFIQIILSLSQHLKSGSLKHAAETRTTRPLRYPPFRIVSTCVGTPTTDLCLLPLSYRK